MLVLATIFLLIASARCQYSALKQRQQFKASDFVFNLFGSTPNVIGTGGTGRRADINELPSLQGLGVSSVLFNIAPCGINLPHVHPRGTELFHVLDGQFQTGFLEENSGRVILNNLTQGMVTIFPQGLIHFEQNLGCTPARFLSSFSNEDPGVLTISTRLFDFPQQALTSTFSQSNNVINYLKSNLKVNPAMGNGECLKRCGLA